jgi:hypothetical protein
MKEHLMTSRRRFLVGAGGATLALPLLPSLNRTSRASEIPRKNFITYRITNGHYGHQWYPSDVATGGSAGLRIVEPNVREMRLEDIAGPISPLLDARFDRFRSKMNLMRHIDRMDGSNHQRANTLFGWSWDDEETPDGFYAGLPPSIDQLISEHVFMGTMAPLNLSVSWQAGATYSVRVDGSGNLAYASGLMPHQAFEQLFADLRAEPGVAERRRAYRRSIVDRVLPQYQSLRDNPRLSTRDKHLLDEHVEHMHAIQRQLAQNLGACEAPDAPSDFDLREGAQVTPAGQAAIDIAVAAIRCGIARVVNLNLDPNTRFDTAIHGLDHHHGSSHDSDEASVRQIQYAHEWHMDRMLELITQLDDTPTEGGTLLDDSLVLLTNEIGNQAGRSGNAPGDYDNNHLGLDIQTLIVGSAGGAINTGYFLDYRTDFERGRWTRYIGTAFNRVLVTCMLAMGMVPEQWEVDARPGYGDFRGGKYDKTPPDQVVSGDRRGMREMLPRLAAT